MIYVICNPASRSGQGRRLWKKTKMILKNDKLEFRVYKTTLNRSATTITRAILEHDNSSDIRLMVLGGDGTVNEVLQGFSDVDFERVILTYIPTGSSNDLARANEYDKNMITNICHLLYSENYKYMDIGVLTYNKEETLGYSKRYFAVSTGIGYDAAVCQEVNTSKLKSIFNKIGLGKIIYLCIALKQLFETPRCNMELTIDNGETIKLDKCLFASVLNHKFQGGGLMFCPDALADDGVLDICYASGVSPFRVLTLLPLCYKGKHVGKKGIGIHTAKEVRIVSDIPLYVHTDGEVKTTATDITVKVLAGKLRFTV